ncbi:MAG: AMP-binding protein [Gammaproteobacteria bacterium]|nr:AMP-binding protein [Gammaproteobacteria bacterium]MDE2249948.1 AMP-binding protein [Gammaproteobacteria bacterium]
MGAARAAARGQAPQRRGHRGASRLKQRPVNGNLYERLCGQAAADRPFARQAGRGAISYAAMDLRSAQYANALLDLGVQPGDRVLVQAEKSAEAILLYLGCLRCGAVYVPLNTAYTSAELEYYIGDAQPRVVVCKPARMGAVLPQARRLGVAHVVTMGGAEHAGSLLERADLCDTRCPNAERDATEVAAIIYTSGTTGRAKGAMLTHANLAANAFALKAGWRFTPQDVLLHALPLFHIHGLFVAVNVTLAAGASLLVLPAFEVESVVQNLPAASVYMGVPTHYVRLLQHRRLDRGLTANVRLFVSGSAPLLPDTHAEWLSRTGHSILERYGMSETGIIASNPYGGERIAGTVGLPLPGVAVRVVDPDNGAPVPVGQTGMLEVKGPNVFAGYWRMPDRTQAEFRADGYFVTGDVGRFDARGYLSIVGRSKDLVITGGFNVYPREVEAELDALAGVAESAVFGVPHPDFGEGVTAVVVARGPLAAEPLLAQLRQRLAGYKIPKRILVVAELPRNSMGKVQKSALREQYADLYQPASGPRSVPT